MNNKKIVFLILHYYTIDDTIKCVNSIKSNIDADNYEIVIVDNASPNGTGKELEKLYKNDNKIHVLINNKNLGFAQGNNIGFKYAKDRLKADFIVMQNNDTYLIQKDFYNIILNEYNESNFGVLGPKIILKNNKINGTYTKLPTIKEQKRKLLILKILYIVNLFNIEHIFLKVKNLLKKILKKNTIQPQPKVEEELHNQTQKNIILHGCCLIFSPKYIELFDGLDDRTFLYCEEELLFIRLMNNGLISIYNPQLLIFHNEDAATNAITKTKRKKAIFTYKNLIKSNKILLEELKEYYMINK